MRDTRVKILTHPATGRELHPVGWRRDGRPIWPVLGASEPPNQPPPAPTGPPAPPPSPPVPPTGQPPAPSTPPPGDKGYPEGTPLAEMTTEQQVAYWRTQSRKHEAEAKKRGDYDALKTKADQFDALEAASRTEHEKAVEEARKAADTAARADERGKLGPQLVGAHLRAALTGRLADVQRDALITGVKTEMFLSADGTVDPAAVQTWVDQVAPATTAPPGRGAPDLGQGRRSTPPAQTGVAAGAALWAERHPRRASQQQT